MKLFHSLNDISILKQPIGLAIGNLDGVHLGHLAIINKLRQLVTTKGSVIVLTFANPPSEFFQPEKKIPRLQTLSLKLHYIKKAGVDGVIVLPFDQTIARLSFDVFLDQIRKKLPFSFFLRGKGSFLGKDKKGDEKAICTYAKNHHFKAEYLPLTQIDNQPVTSTLIRKLIIEGDLDQASKLLGRDYAIEPQVVQFSRSSPYDVCEIVIPEQCLPPNGQYKIEVEQGSLKLSGIFHCNKKPKIIFSSHDSFDRNRPFLVKLIQFLQKD